MHVLKHNQVTNNQPNNTLALKDVYNASLKKFPAPYDPTAWTVFETSEEYPKLTEEEIQQLEKRNSLPEQYEMNKKLIKN